MNSTGLGKVGSGQGTEVTTKGLGKAPLPRIQATKPFSSAKAVRLLKL